jgi:N6-adenosine-specific RNA methylase IME4
LNTLNFQGRARAYSYDYLEYLRVIARSRRPQYAIIDPPWNYNDKPPKAVKQLSYNLWRNNKTNILNLFYELKLVPSIKIVYLWCTNAILAEMLAGFYKYSCSYQECPFEYKTLITWNKLTTNSKPFYGLGSWYRNSTEQVALFARHGTKPLHLSSRNAFSSIAGKRTIKPKDWELQTITDLHTHGYTNGCYLFSGTDIDMFEKFNIDCVDIAL